MVSRLLVGFVWLNLQFSVSWLVDFQWGSCGSIFSFLCHGWQTFSGVRVAQSLVFCVMVGRLLVGFVWLNLQSSMSWQVDFQWGSCGSIFSFLCHGWQTFSGVRVAQSLVFCVMVGRLLVGFVWLNLQFSVSWQVDFQWVRVVSIFSFLCHGRQTFSGFRVAQSLVFCVMVGRLLVGFVWLNLFLCHSFSVHGFCVMVDFQWGSCGSIFSFLCHGWQTFSGVRVAQSLVFCVMVGRLLVGFVWLNLQFSVSWQVDFQWGSCGSIFSFLCHGWQTFSGVRVAQSLGFCVMVGRLLVGLVWLNLQFSVSWLVDFQWGSCGSIFSFLCHGWQTFSGVRVAQSLVFCVMVGRLLVGFVWLNLQFSVSWQVDFQWGSCGSIFSLLCHGRQTFSGVRVAQSLVFCVMVGRLLVGSCGSIFSFLCHGWQTFSGVRVAQSLVFCVMVGRLLVGSCGSIFRFLCHGRQTFSGVVWLNLQFSVSWLVDFQWGSCGSIFSFLCHGWQTFSGVRVAQSLVFCVMVGRLLVGFVWLNLQFSVSWLVDFQWGSCGSIFSLLCHGRQTFSGVRVAQSLVFCVMVGRLLVGFVWLNLYFSVSWLVDFQSGSCGSIFSFLCHGWQTFSWVRVAQSLDFCVMVGRLLAGFVRLNLQFSVSWLVDFQQGSCGSIFSFVSWLVDFQWGSCGSIFGFLCHGWQTFSGVRVAQSLVFCVMVGRLLVGFVWLNLQFCVMVGRFLVGFVWLNLQFSVSWLLDFQWGSCGSIFNFLCHGWQIFSGVRVAQSLVFCVMVGRLLVWFVWLNLQLSVSWLVDFQWGSCGSIFSFCVMVGRLLVGFVWLNLQFSVSWLVDFQWASCGSIFCLLCHGRQTFSGVRVAQSLVFCVMVGRLLVGFVSLNLQFCAQSFSFLCHGWQTFSGVRVAQSLVSVSWQVDFQWGSCGSIFSFLCHGWQTFSGVRVAQSLVFCVMVGRLLVGFVWLNLQFSVSWLVDFQWGSCGSIFSFLCHGWQTFSGVRVAQSLVFCVMVGRLLVGFVWLNLQSSMSWQVDFQWGSCGSIFSFLFLFSVSWQTFSRVRVAQSLVFCVMVGRLLVGFVWLNLQFSVSWQVDVWLNLQFSVSWLVDFQWGSCGSIFCFCVMVGRLLVGFVWLNLQFSVSWQVDFQWVSCRSIFSFVSWLVDFQWVSCGSIFSFLCHGWQTFSGVRVAQSLVFCFLCHGWQTFSGVRVAQSLVFCVMVGRLLVGFVWLNLQFSVSWLVDFQWGSCGSIFSFLCHDWQTFSGVRVAQSLVFCVMVGRLLVGFVWLNLQFSVSWQVDFQWGSCGSIFSLLCHGRQTFSGVRVAQSLVFCVMVGRLLVGSCGSIFIFLCHGWQTFSGVRVAQSLAFCVMVGRLLVGFVWLNLQISVSWQVDFQRGSCGSIFSFLCHGWQTFSGVRVAQSLVLCHGWQTFSGVRVAQSLVFCVMVGRLLVGFVWLNLQFSVSWLVDIQWGSCGSIFSLLCHGRQTFSGVRVAQSLVFCVMVGRLLVGFVWLNLQFSVSWLVDFQSGSCGSIFSFLCHGWQTFSGVRVAQSLDFCVMVGRLLAGFVRLNLQFSVSWLVDFQQGSCGSIFSFVSWLVDFQWGSCGSIFCFLCHGWQTFSGVRVAQSLVFCVMVGRLLVGFVWLNLQFCVMVGRFLVGFVWLNLQFSVSWLLDFQWGSCGSIFSFLCHGWQIFSGVRVAQSLVFCVMVGRLLVGFVWLNLQLSVSWLVDFQWGSCGSIFSFCVMVGRLLVGFVWLNLQFSVSWLVDFQWVRVAQSLCFCVMVGRFLVGFVWLNLQFSVSWLVDFQWVRVAQSLVLCHGWQTFSRVSCGSIFRFSVSWLVDFQQGSCGSIFSFLCHGWQTFSGVRVAQSLVFCVMVGRLLVGFVWLNLQFSVSWLVDFQWVRVAQSLVLCHGWQIFSGVRVAQSLVFCVMIGRHLVGFVWLNLQFSVSWLVDFQWGSCGSIFSFLCHGWQTFSGFVWLNLWQTFSRVPVAQSLVLCHGWQTFSGVRVAQSFVFCVMVGRLLVGFVWLNLGLLCHGRQTFSGFRVGFVLNLFSGARVAQSLVFCVMVGRLLVGLWLNLYVMVGRLLVGFVWLNLQFSVSWLVDFQWGSCGSIFSFLCHDWQTSVMIFYVMVDFQWGSCGSIFSFLCHGWQTFSGLRVAQSLVFCVMVGRLLVGFVWLNLQFSVSWQVDFQWGSCGSILSFLCHDWQTFSGVRVAQSLVFYVMVGRLLVGCGSCGSIFSFLCHGWQTFSGVRVAQSLVFCVMVGRLLVGFVWLNLQFSVSWLVDFQWGSCGSIFSFLCHDWQTFSGARVAQSLVFCVMVGRLLVGFVWLNLQFSVS